MRAVRDRELSGGQSLVKSGEAAGGAAGRRRARLRTEQEHPTGGGRREPRSRPASALPDREALRRSRSAFRGGTACRGPAAPDKPPIAQGWIDLATFSSPGLHGAMGGDDDGRGGGGDTPLSALLAERRNGNQFGLTRAAAAAVTSTSRCGQPNPCLAEALQAVPPGTSLRRRCS